MGLIDRILIGWFRFNFPTRLTTAWPHFIADDLIRHHYMPILMRDIYEPSPLMRMLEGD